MSESVRRSADIVVVGAGAAGLMAAIHAGRGGTTRRVLVVDSARRLGAKILISGGGRCNVTHHQVTARDFSGSSPHAIGKVLRSFDVERTIGFFRDLGVALEREDSGKLFPASNTARTVLGALLEAARDAGAEFAHPCRVDEVTREADGFLVCGRWGRIAAARVILATGGRSIPRSGSDGHGYEIARALGHHVTPTFPALVPLLLPAGHWVTSLGGVALEAEVSAVSSSGKKLATAPGAVLCTHFGVSGPAILDISRHLNAARLDDPGAGLSVNWIPGRTSESLLEEWRAVAGDPVARVLRRALPNRFADALLADSAIDPAVPLHELKKQERRRLARLLVEHRLPVTTDRGYNYAEVTAGGIPLSEIRLASMESRLCPGLFLCGEICDVDGRIGGFNFQWAWSSGYLAGTGSRGNG